MSFCFEYGTSLLFIPYNKNMFIPHISNRLRLVSIATICVLSTLSPVSAYALSCAPQKPIDPILSGQEKAEYSLAIVTVKGQSGSTWKLSVQDILSGTNIREETIEAVDINAEFGGMTFDKDAKYILAIRQQDTKYTLSLCDPRIELDQEKEKYYQSIAKGPDPSVEKQPSKNPDKDAEEDDFDITQWSIIGGVLLVFFAIGAIFYIRTRKLSRRS